jgi:O-antigen/teichoic acid export membrane protein
MLLAQFAILGMNAVTIKLFPYFRDQEKKHHGFLGLAILISLAGFLFSTGIYLMLHDYIISNAKEKSSMFIPYFYYVIPLFFFTMLFGLFDTYYRVLYNAVKGTIYKEVVQRVLVILSILLFYFEVVDFQTMVILYTISMIAPTIFLFLELIKDKQLFLIPDFNFLDKKLVKQISTVALFGIISSYSGVLIMNIDLVMVDHYLGLSQAGVYTIAFFFGTLVIIPARTMGKITSVVIADAWKSDDKKTILDIYKKSTLSLPVAGTLVFIGLWANIDNVFSIIGPNYEPGKYVILFIGLANLVEMFASSSSHVIVNSPKYKWLSYLLLIYTVIIIITNILFIPVYGIIGAAIASLISRVIYGLLRFTFLRYYYHFQPYNFKHMLIVIVGFSVWYISTFIPHFEFFVNDIIIRSTVISVLFIPTIYFLHISEDINRMINLLLKRITNN